MSDTNNTRVPCGGAPFTEAELRAAFPGVLRWKALSAAWWSGDLGDSSPRLEVMLLHVDRAGVDADIVHVTMGGAWLGAAATIAEAGAAVVELCARWAKVAALVTAPGPATCRHCGAPVGGMMEAGQRRPVCPECYAPDVGGV